MLQKSHILNPLVALCSLLVVAPAHASVFGQREIPSNRVVAVASPYGENQHQLLVIQQLDAYRQCWSEAGAGPTMVDPLLVNFDFTGICGRSIDSNGYSIRLANEDLGWRYSLRVVKRNGDMLLVGTPTGNKNAPELLIGSVGGSADGFTKIQLNPGWRMTQRTYFGDTLGHIYFTHEQPLSAFATPSGTQTASQMQRLNGVQVKTTEVGDRIVPVYR
jgi:N-acetylmuramoyl-L-alanine amidase